MRNRILRTLGMLGLSVCLLAGSALAGFAADAPAKEPCKENEHEWKVETDYKDECVKTEFRVGNETITLCPHCGKQNDKERLTKVKNTFSNFSNLEVYAGTLENGQKAMTVAFYYPTFHEKVFCTKCDTVKSETTTKARVLTSAVTANIEIPAETLGGASLVCIRPDGTRTPVSVSFSEDGRKAFFQLDMSSGAQLLYLV